jgi:hypothetical protein
MADPSGTDPVHRCPGPTTVLGRWRTEAGTELGTRAVSTEVGKGSASIQESIDTVDSAAYGSFAHGLDRSLQAAGSLLTASAVVAYVTASGRSSTPTD